MANPNVGMMYPVFAPLVSHTDGSMPTYGTGRVIQEARNATVTKTYNENPLYGDDRIVDDDNGLQSLTMSFESTGLSDADRVALFGESQATVGGLTAYLEGDNETPWGGFGYIRKMRLNGEKKFEAWIALKIKFQEESQATQTKEGTISWGTPTLNGRAAALYIDSSDEMRFRAHQTFDTIAAAKAWINTVLNVSAATT
jgi:phi13 family phage major tail protein